MTTLVMNDSLKSIISQYKSFWHVSNFYLILFVVYINSK